MEINAKYVDKSGWRTAGLVVFAGSLVAGLTLMLIDNGSGGAVWYTGAGVAIAGGITGGIMLAQNDEAILNARPVSPAAKGK